MGKPNGAWHPDPGMPALEQLEAMSKVLDDEIGARPWLDGRVRVDTFATNYIVNALASLLIQHGILAEAEIDYKIALVEVQSKQKLESSTRVPPDDWDPNEDDAVARAGNGAPRPRLLLPGRDF